MISTDYEKCTGCGACVQKCPQKCIHWINGEFGFKYPKANENECISCGLCDKVCPIVKERTQPEDQTVYALVNRDKTVLTNSTSGGAFSALAEKILSDGGVVYGCAITSDFQVRHIRVEARSEISKLRGSKYVQSDTGDVFYQISEDLKNRRKVFFTGTPCQVAGLYGFLGKNYDNLLTADIICHGVGSQAYFDKYVEWVKTKMVGLERIEFRNKKFVGWSCGGLFKVNGQDKPFYNHTHYYYSYFLAGEIYRKSCYSCSYANINRAGDITLGDFWGIERQNVEMDVSNGCSLVIVNTEKGNKVISSISNDVSLNKIDISAALDGNEQLIHPSNYATSRNDRLKEFDTLSGQKIQNIYRKTHAKRILIGKMKTLMPYGIKKRLRRIM